MSAAFVGRALAKVELSVFFPPLRGEGNLRDPRRKGAKPTRPTAERAMRAFLAANPKDKHGAHRYSLEQFGLDADEQDRRFAAYRARFGC